MFELRGQKIQYGDLIVFSTALYPFRIGVVATKDLHSTLLIYFPSTFPSYQPRYVSVFQITYIRVISIKDLRDSFWLRWLPNCQHDFRFQQKVKSVVDPFLRWCEENPLTTLLTREGYFREFAKKELNLK